MTPTQRFICHDPQSDPVDDLEQCEGSIRAASWWERSGGLAEHWPLMTDEVAQLLSEAGEFEIDALGLHDLIDRGLLASPAVGESLEWSAADVILASGLLESRQQWRSTPSGHDPKKHACQLILEQARAVGEVPSIVAGPVRFDVRHLLGMLVVCENREGREKIIALLKAILEVDHGVAV